MMRSAFIPLLAALISASAFAADVRLTALQVISTDTNGKIQGVGGHRFRTTQHGGHPCLFLIKGTDFSGKIENAPCPAQNGIDITLNAGVHVYSILAEKVNSYDWPAYTLQLYFDGSNTPQVSGLAPLALSNVFFPPVEPNREFTEALNGYSVKAPGTLLYKSGLTEVRLSSFFFARPQLFSSDRIGPFDTKPNKVLEYVGQLVLEVTGPPAIAPGGVVNGASFVSKVAPGSLFTIFGSHLAPSAQSAESLPLPRNLGGTSVTIGGKPAPLMLVSPTQINAQVPYETLEGQNVPVVVAVSGADSQPVNVTVVRAAPGIFQFSDRRAVVHNPDYTVNNNDNPAPAGSYVVAYLTGAGRLDNAVPSGVPASAEPISRPRGPVTATLAGMPAEVVFGGLTPNFVGLMQVNFKIPSMPAGTYPLVVTVDGETSNAALVTVQ